MVGIDIAAADDADDDTNRLIKRMNRCADQRISANTFRPPLGEQESRTRFLFWLRFQEEVRKVG